GEERFINKSFYAYNEPSFSSGKANAGALYSPQNFRVVDGTTSGWLKIKTWEGDKWMNLNAEDTGVEFYVEATAYSVEGSPPNERITASGIDIGKNPNIKLIAVDPKVAKNGLQIHFLATLGSGATGFVYHGKFEPKTYLNLLDDNKVNVLCCTPTEYRLMAKVEDLSQYNLEALHSAVSAGEPLNREVIETFKKHFHITVRDGYGQTENTLLVG
ncbi:AMP-binding protein, partial [Bacillus sp. SS-TM]